MSTPTAAKPSTASKPAETVARAATRAPEQAKAVTTRTAAGTDASSASTPARLEGSTTQGSSMAKPSTVSVTAPTAGKAPAAGDAGSRTVEPKPFVSDASAGDPRNNALDSKGKLKALEAAMGQIEKSFGKGSIMKLDGETRWPKSQTVPLYLAPQPTLTDEEREALEWAAGLRDKRPSGCRTTLRALLERLK